MTKNSVAVALAGAALLTALGALHWSTIESTCDQAAVEVVWEEFRRLPDDDASGVLGDGAAVIQLATLTSDRWQRAGGWRCLQVLAAPHGLSGGDAEVKARLMEMAQ